MPNEKPAGEIEHARKVREMFSRISPKYDFLNHFLSINIDKRWRQLVRKRLMGILGDSDSVILDVACGTGDLSIVLQKDSAATIIGTDFCRPMLALAAEKNGNETFSVPYLEGDAMALPFPNDCFDAVTIAFGLRNLSNWRAGLLELQRILKPSGMLVILEFSQPVVPGFRQAFQLYFNKVLPKIGGAISGEQDAYEYLSVSVSKFPNQKELAAMMRENGFSKVEYKNLTGGIAAIHVGAKK